jgi:hypothetical protein
MAGLAAVLMPAAPALAHCDSVSGPVVTAASQALEQNDVTLILPYIQAADETELTAAFKEAREARQQGGAAAKVADQWFFETAVRLHRQGEGAPYTGLKENADYGPALEAAGAFVTWDAQAQKATVQLQGSHLAVAAGAGGAVLIPDRLMVPAGLLAEALGLQLELHGSSVVLTH